jgi:4-hydroxybenzoate polyprenyltransferase
LIALVTFELLAAATLVLIFFLPFPQSAYVAASLCYCYGMEWFYQVKKRNQRLPVSQLLGRTDFALFPAAGYMAVAGPAPLAFLYMATFYPLAQAHLGVNDLADVRNDEARGMKSVPLLYGNRGTGLWIALFSSVHIVLLTLLLIPALKQGMFLAMLLPFTLLGAACISILSAPTPNRALRMLPLIHATIALEAGIIITDAAMMLAARS